MQHNLSFTIIIIWLTNFIDVTTVNNLAFLITAEYDLANREESTTANTIYYPALPLDQSGERNGSSTALYSNEQPPSSSHPSGHGQLLAEAHGAGMTGMPNIPAGSTAIPATVHMTHTQPSHVVPGTDPLSSPSVAGQPPFTRRWVPLPTYIMILSVVWCFLQF